MTRLAALLLIVLIAVHLIGQHVWLGESPVWFNVIQLIRIKLFADAPAVPFWTIGLGVTVAALLVSWTLWRWRSRLAALVFLAAALWEGWWRYQQLSGALDRGHVLGTPVVAGGILAAAALLIALLAVWGAFSVHGLRVPGRSR